MLYDWNTEERVQNLIEFARLAGLMFTLLSKKYLQTKTKSLKNEQSINAQITPGQCQSSNDSSRKKNIFLTEKLFYTIFLLKNKILKWEWESVCVLMRVTKLIMKIKTVSLEFSGFLVFNDEELSNQTRLQQLKKEHNFL